MNYEYVLEELKPKNPIDMRLGRPPQSVVARSHHLLMSQAGEYNCEDGTDARNYGNLGGIQEIKEFARFFFGINSHAFDVFVHGSSALDIMYRVLLRAHLSGLPESKLPFLEDSQHGLKWLCPVPGYDRHFAMLEDLGYELIPVTLTAEGPSVSEIKAAVRDPGVKGIWCMPTYSNPTGICYSEAFTKQLLEIQPASKSFLVLWDDVYRHHHLETHNVPNFNAFELAESLDTSLDLFVFGSTSKITYAGSGVAMVGSTQNNIEWIHDFLALSNIGAPEKLRQLELARALPDLDSLQRLMEEHARDLLPRRDTVLKVLSELLGDIKGISWTKPGGGYFILLDCGDRRASKTVATAKENGVLLTPAGAMFPYGIDPEDRYIRIAFTSAPFEKLEAATRIIAYALLSVIVENSE